MTAILCVGKDVRLLESRGEILRQKTGAVVKLASSKEAPAAIRRENFDLVVLCHTVDAVEAKQISDAIREQEPTPLVLGLSPLWNPDRSHNNVPFDGFSSAEPTSLVNAAAKLLQVREELPESDVSRI
jgi:DNA-binding NtrC family response regulator